MANEHKFPSEIIDLPSEGKCYSKDSPLSNGKLEIKYMTAKEEDILTSQNLIQKGLVIEQLLRSLILTDGVTPDDLILGDKNAVMVASRILAYGPEYSCEISNPKSGELINHTFNLVGPVGDVVEEWELVGAYIQTANFGDLSFEDSTPVEITCTLRYDYAVLKF